jgi:hypothetical protein
LIDASADFFVCEKLPFVELLQASCHLLAEPSVMVDVVFHKLFDVFLCAALVLGSGPLHFRSASFIVRTSLLKILKNGLLKHFKGGAESQAYFRENGLVR